MAEVYEGNLASYKYAVEKGRNILIDFLDHCRYSSLLRHPNSADGSLVPFQYSVECETVSMNFSHLIPLNPWDLLGLSMEFLSIRGFVYCALVIWKYWCPGVF